MLSTSANPSGWIRPFVWTGAPSSSALFTPHMRLTEAFLTTNLLCFRRSTGGGSAVPPVIAAISEAVCFVSGMPTHSATMTFLPAGVTRACEDLRLQHLAEARAVPVLRDVHVELTRDMLPHNLRPLLLHTDIGNSADASRGLQL